MEDHRSVSHHDERARQECKVPQDTTNSEAPELRPPYFDARAGQDSNAKVHEGQSAW